MKQNEFGELLKVLAKGKHGLELEEKSFGYFFGLYNHAIKEIKEAAHLENMIQLLKADPHWFRDYLADSSLIEMTPDQARIYILVIELALIEEGVEF